MKKRVCGLALLSSWVFFPLTVHAAGTSVCSLPTDHCEGTGCQIRQKAFKPLPSQDGSQLRLHKIPVQISVPEDACTNGQTVGISHLPIRGAKDLKASPSSNSVDIGLVYPVTKMPSDMNLVYTAWIATSPPSCTSAFGSVAAGEKMTSYSRPKSAADLSCSSAKIVSTCASDGSGKFDIVPQAFNSCAD